MKWLKKESIYNFLCVYMPLLYIYKSPIPGVDWGTMLVLVFALSMMSEKRQNGNTMPVALVYLLVYTIACTLLNIAIGTNDYSDYNSVIMRTSRFVVVMSVMMGAGYSRCFEPVRFLKLLRGLSLFVAGYALLQAFVFKVTGLKLINVIGNVNDDLLLTSALGEYEYMYRPPSIFLEPSAACYFLVPYLCYLLFQVSSNDDKVNKLRFREALFISLAMLFTTSGQGLTVLAVVWGIWFIRSVRYLDAKRVVSFAVILIYLLYNFDFTSTIDRVTTEDNINAIDAREEGYLLLSQLSVMQRIFGTGFGNYVDTIYYSSFAEIMFCLGYVGLAIVLLLLLKPFLKGTILQRILVISCVLLMSGGGIFTASYLCLYLPLICYDNWDNVKKY